MEEGFHDYTLATKLERLVAQLEQCFRGWMLTGLENISHLPPALGSDRQPINLVRVSSNITHRMPWRAQPYILTLHVPYTREADLQAARQRQQQQQQQQQQQIQQQQEQQVAVQPAVTDAGLQQPKQKQLAEAQRASVAPPSAAAVAAEPADAGTSASAAAASEALARQVVAAAAGGQGSDAMHKLQAELTPLLNNGGGGAGVTGSNNNGSNNQQQLQQQVDELIQQYHQLHLQLQEDGDQQQQQEEGEEEGAPDQSGAEAGSDTDAVEDAAAAATGKQRSAGSSSLLASAAATAARDALSGLGLTGFGGGAPASSAAAPAAAMATTSSSTGGGASPPPARDVTRVESPEGAKGSAQKVGKKLGASKKQRRTSAAGETAAAAFGSRKASSAGAGEAVLLQDDAQSGQPTSAGVSASAGASAAAAAAAEEGLDEATSRQVELPAPEQLVDANSRALAAVKAAVQQDLSRTAASRSWWPFCFDLSLVQQQLQQLHLHAQQQQQPATAAAVVRGMPSVGLPWWSPGSSSNKLQRWFGLDLFVLLQPASYSRRFLDAAESSSLLSVGRLALSSCGVCWPLLLPVHDALRDAYVGVAQVGGLSVLFNTDSVHLSRLPKQLSSTEQQLALLAEQLGPHHPAAAAACLAVLGQHSSGGTCTPTAIAASPARSSSSAMWLGGAGRQQDASKQQQQQEHQPGCGPQYGVWMSACFTYRLPDASKRFGLQQVLSATTNSTYQQQHQQLGTPYGQHQHHPQHAAQQLVDPIIISHDDEESEFLDWDADSAWHPWAQHRDPILALELDVVWRDQQLAADGDATPGDSIPQHAAHSGAVASAVATASAATPAAGAVLSPAGMAALLADAACADVWVLHVLQHGYSSTPARSGRLGVKGYERHRRHVRVEAAGADWLWTTEAAHQVLAYGGRLSGVCPQPWGFPNPMLNPTGPQVDPGSFTTMLSALLTARTAAVAAHSLWELAGAEWWESRGEPSAPPLPPDSVFDSVLRDLLSPPKPPTAATAAAAAGSGGSSGGLAASRRASRDLGAGTPAPLSLSRASSGVGPAVSPLLTPTSAGAAAGAGAEGGGGRLSLQEPSTAAAAAAAAGGSGDDMLPRSAPPGSLLCRLALHALVFGNARAIAALWQRFVVQARLQFWEQRTLLPHLPAGQHNNSSSTITAGGRGSAAGATAANSNSSSRRNSMSLQGAVSAGGAAAAAGTSAFAAASGPHHQGSSSGSGGSGAAVATGVAGGGPPAPDMDSCLVHQKLQMLNMCIWRRDKRLARGMSSKLQQQQQQQSRHASSNSIPASKSSAGISSSSGSGAEDSDSNAGEGAGAATTASGGRGSSSRLATAASSTFYSTAGDDDGDNEGGDGDEAAADDVGSKGDADAFVGQEEAGSNSSSSGSGAADAEDVDDNQQQRRRRQRQQHRDLFEDANSEFYSLTGNNSLSGAVSSSNSANTTAAGAAATHLLEDPSAVSAAAAVACDPDAEPQGVAAVVPGQTLLLYPDRPLRVPVAQDDPVFTEDQILQKQVALMQLATAAAEAQSARRGNGGGSSGSSGSGSGSAAATPGVASSAAEMLLLKQRLLGAPLLSDMCAFKAANPGCCFEDFLRWYSPKDWQQQADQQQVQQDADVVEQQPGGHQQLHHSSSQSSSQASCSGQAAATAAVDTDSGPAADADSGPPAAAAAAAGGSASKRMGSGATGGPSNDWQQLWLLAEPQPASAQRPLLNPHKEGELVLHYLETLSPPALFSQLLAAAVCEALSLLGASRGAALPAAAAVVDRFRSMAAGVLRKGGGLSEALSAAAAAAGPPGREQQQQQHNNNQQQQQHEELAGDWQGAEDGLSDVELELLLAEFAYVEQVVVLAESLLHHLPGQPGLAARLLQHLLHGSADPNSNNSSNPNTAAAAATAEEAAVLGTGSRLPVACLSLQERHALMRWVAACAHAEQTSKAQRDFAHVGARQLLLQQQQLQQQELWDADRSRSGGSMLSSEQQQTARQYPSAQDSSAGGVGGASINSSSSRQWDATGLQLDSSHRQQQEGVAGDGSGQPGSHLLSLSSPRADWPVGEDGAGSLPSPAAAAAATAATGAQTGTTTVLDQQQQQVPPLGANHEHTLQELRRLQHALGHPVQQEWVTTCGPLPARGVVLASSSSGSSGSALTPQKQQRQQGVSTGRKLQPAVAAAVAAAVAGAGGVAAAAGGACGVAAAGVGASSQLVPPSRLYVQEADGEMRLATVLVSQQGL